ncbi:MAG: patatin-like phospholipase domain-containing protein [Nevskiales bacterium]|nr:patatin-like phospholipase domain-containing protein [Nevskiales bacterium]
MDLRSVLAESVLFATLPPPALDALAAIAVPRLLKSGEQLFAKDDPAEHLYVVAAGRLRATLDDGFVAGYIGPLEPIGEIGLLSSENRTATVHALRDSLLIQIRRDRLMEVLIAHPLSLVAITRILIGRLRQNQRQLKLNSVRGAHTFAVIPATPEIDSVGFAQALHRQLSGFDTCRSLTAADVDAELGESMAHTPYESDPNTRLIEWLNRQERNHRYLIYAAGSSPDPWARRCMRQADRVLVVADATTLPLATPMMDALRRSGILATVALVLLRPAQTDGGDVLAWKDQTGAGTHHFVRPGNSADMESLARQLTGRALGLVLGGGGARGFAHVGLIRALEELRIPVHVAGGSSMGAFISALLASGYTSHEMLHLLRETFVTHNHLNDYMFPRIALIRGRKFLRRLQAIFGDRRIEHLRLPWFCVSTNLTRGTAMVHDHGSLALWVATSMAVPGIAPPMIYKGELLADGAVVNSLPTDVMQSLERGQIIASDVSTEGDIRAPGIEGPDPEGLLHWAGPGEPPNLRDILFRTATLTSESGVRRRAASSDLYLRMPVGGIRMLEWKRLDEIVEHGYRLAIEKLTEARERLLR